MAGEIEVKVGEGKWISFTVTRGSVAVPLTGAQFLFAIKADEDDTSYLLAKSGESFDISQAAAGIVRVNVSATETTALGVGSFLSELKIILTADQDVDKSEIIPFEVRSSVIHT